MIVRDLGDAWQVILQTDHGDLAADFARAWGDRGPHHDSLLIAAERHDDGWAVWESSPRVNDEGRPVPFLEVGIESHLAFYRACIAAVTEEDAYAGLLVSTHGAGIYRQRYGADPGLKLTQAEAARELVDAFVAEQENARGVRLEACGVSEEQLWRDYHVLQHLDRLSLHACMRDTSTEPGGFTNFTLSPTESGFAVDPYPFDPTPVRGSLVRRVVPKRAWTQAEFRSAFWSLPAEQVEVVVSPVA